MCSIVAKTANETKTYDRGQCPRSQDETLAALKLVQDGEEVLIRRHGKLVARIVAVPSSQPFPFGCLKGEFELLEGWDRPLTDDEADAFWDGKG